MDYRNEPQYSLVLGLDDESLLLVMTEGIASFYRYAGTRALTQSEASLGNHPTNA